MSKAFRQICWALGFVTLIFIGGKQIDAAVFYYFPFGADGTDGTYRSGMALRTDHGTGCQYLVSPWGGITPRFDRDGKQVCTN